MASTNGVRTDNVSELPRGTVLIAGAGPVGLILAQVLSYFGVRSVIFERNLSTTKWPKMDLTNARSMEIFRKLGLAESLRQQGVPPQIGQDVLISTGLSREKALTGWDLPSVDQFRARINETNDGTQPNEPWQRLSQEIFERWLKEICVSDPLIEVNCGWRLDSAIETEEGAEATLVNLATGVASTFRADYMVGCDGGSSVTRKSLGTTLEGGPLPVCALLVHFKSRDLARLHRQGRFWHIFFLEPNDGGLGGAIIAQDEVDTWTTHLFLPAGSDTHSIESHEAVYRVLGGIHGKFQIDIDKILVRSVWKPTIAVTRDWAGPKRRIFLAGDAAHQNIPTGGYGMNMGIGDAFDLGWKLASVVKGSGGSALLESYQAERKPVAWRNVQRSGEHFQVHQGVRDVLGGQSPHILDEDSEEAREMRRKIHDHYQTNDGENKDFGIEMGYRYKSLVIVEEKSTPEPSWIPSSYTPTTWPGGRAPHLFLSNGTPIFDRFGRDWTLVEFSGEDCGQNLFVEAAQRLRVPLMRLSLPTETLAKKVYEQNLVLIRPDHHVAWRGEKVDNIADCERILGIVTGREISPRENMTLSTSTAHHLLKADFVKVPLADALKVAPSTL